MAKTSGLAEQYFAHGYDLSGDVGAINNCSCPRGTFDVTAINSNGVERLLGLGDGLLDFNSWFNDAAAQEHAALKGLPTTDVIQLWAIGGAVGDVAAGLVAKQVNYDPTRDAPGSLEFNIQALGQGNGLEYLDMLSAGKITHSSAASSASKDDGAGTTQGFIAYLEMVDIDSGTPTVLIEHSTNDSSWSTLLSFSAIANGAEPTAERKTANGTVNRYLRITTTGTFVNADFAVAYRRGTAQDDVSLA